MTTSTTRKIISGEPVQIDAPVPGVLEGVKGWQMIQPEEWLHEDAQLIFRATFQRVLAMDEMQSLKDQPPSEAWRGLHKLFRERAENRVKELRKLKERTPDEETELLERQDYLNTALTPDEWSLAQELAQERALTARDQWLMPRLIVDTDGKPLFNMDNGSSGKAKWQKVPRHLKDTALRRALDEVLGYIRAAKNSDGGTASKPE